MEIPDLVDNEGPGLSERCRHVRRLVVSKLTMTRGSKQVARMCLLSNIGLRSMETTPKVQVQGTYEVVSVVSQEFSQQVRLVQIHHIQGVPWDLLLPSSTLAFQVVKNFL